MATRTFCDQCGNTVKNPRRFSFGPVPAHEPGPFHGNGGGVGVLGSGGGAFQQARSVPVEQHFPIVVIDLCPVCAPIWMKRAEALTKASDTDAQSE